MNRNATEHAVNDLNPVQNVEDIVPVKAELADETIATSCKKKTVIAQIGSSDLIFTHLSYIPRFVWPYNHARR